MTAKSSGQAGPSWDGSHVALSCAPRGMSAPSVDLGSASQSHGHTRHSSVSCFAGPTVPASLTFGQRKQNRRVGENSRRQNEGNSF